MSKENTHWIAHESNILTEVDAWHFNPSDKKGTEEQSNRTGLLFTRITSREPPILTKYFDIGPDNKLDKHSVAYLYEGHTTQVSAKDLEAFDQQLNALKPEEAMVFGIAEGHPQAPLVTKDQVVARPGAISRSRDFFSFHQGPGIMMLDHDPRDEDRRSPEELTATIRGLAPCLAKAAMLRRPSASSGVHNHDRSIDTGIAGQRIYLQVQDASLIPEAGKALIALLWAQGHGYIQIGKAGQALLRTLLDGSVWQPERLDFAAAPVLGEGLWRDPPASVISGEREALLDLRELIAAVDGNIRREAEKARKKALAEAKPELHQAREIWVEETAPVLAKKQGLDIEQVKSDLRRASELHELTWDFLLLCADGTTVRVGDLLENPAKWHGQRFADPLEPDYHQDHRIAWANLRNGGQPYLYSHAHGGRRFALMRRRARLEIRKGYRSELVDQVLDLFRQWGDLYEYGLGDSLVRVTERGEIHFVDAEWLTDYQDRHIRFHVTRGGRKDEGQSESIQDAPLVVANRILAKKGERALPRLNAVISAPILRRDGSVVTEPGYDPSSGLLLMTDERDLPQIPLYPTQDEVRVALDRVWKPFARFPFCDAIDRGVALAAIISAVLRPSLPTAQGFGVDAPMAGTGKTLLAQAIGALALGRAPSIQAPIHGNEEETRKRLFAVVLEGQGVLLWDNVCEPLGSATLDAFLTAPYFNDRILGKSETGQLPNRTLFLTTGNNLRLKTDSARRVLVMRIDAGIEQPHYREFDFCPLRWVVDHRQELVRAVLTLVRGWFHAGQPQCGIGRAASFEDWDHLVRQPICWIGTWDERFADPLEATKRALETDPESNKLSALLEVLDALNIELFTTNDLIRLAPARELTSCYSQLATKQDLYEVLDTIAGERGTINPRRLGAWLAKQVDRRQHGRRLVRRHPRHGVVSWELVRDPTPASDPRGVGGLGGSTGLEKFSAVDRGAEPSSQRPGGGVRLDA